MEIRMCDICGKYFRYQTGKIICHDCRKKAKNREALPRRDRQSLIYGLNEQIASIKRASKEEPMSGKFHYLTKEKRNK